MYHFGVGTGKVSEAQGKKLDKVARKHGATFTWAQMPEGWKFWFSARNLGAPFDDAVREAVLREAEAAGLWPVK